MSCKVGLPLVSASRLMSSAKSRSVNRDWLNCSLYAMARAIYGLPHDEVDYQKEQNRWQYTHPWRTPVIMLKNSATMCRFAHNNWNSDIFSWQYIFVFIRQVAPVPACWLFKTSATSWPLTFWPWKWCLRALKILPNASKTARAGQRTGRRQFLITLYLVWSHGSLWRRFRYFVIGSISNIW